MPSTVRFTVMMTFERYLFIMCPVASKQWSTHKNIIIGMLAIVLVSILLNIEIPLAREVETTYCAKLGYLVHYEFIKVGFCFYRAQLLKKLY